MGIKTYILDNMIIVKITLGIGDGLVFVNYGVIEYEIWVDRSYF